MPAPALKLPSFGRAERKLHYRCELLSVPHIGLQESRPRAASLLFSGCTGQEQSIPIGNVPCLPDFQSPEARLCLWRILAAAFQRCDQLPLVCDVPFTAMETAFGFLQELFIVARAIAAAYRQIDASRFSGMASHAGPTIRQGEWH
jgi:hypothetical protein